VSDPDKFEQFCGRWLGRKVRFQLMGHTCEGIVRSVVDSVCAPMWIVVEFRDGNKQVKVGGPWQGFTRI